MFRKVNAIAALVAAAFLVSAAGSPIRADEKKADSKTTAAAGANRGGLQPGETRDDKRERLVNEIEKQTGPLTKDQKTHIKAIFEAAGDEMGAARANYSLSEEQRSAIVREVHNSVFKRIEPVLTETQRANLKKANEANAGRRGDRDGARSGRDGAGRNEGGLRPGETRDEKRDRLVAGLEKQTGPLTADQKTHIKAIYEAAGDEMGAARANYSLTEEQRSAIVREVHNSVGKRIEPILTEAQRASLQKSRDEHRAKRNAEKKEQK